MIEISFGIVTNKSFLNVIINLLQNSKIQILHALIRNISHKAVPIKWNFRILFLIHNLEKKQLIIRIMIS